MHSTGAAGAYAAAKLGANEFLFVAQVPKQGHTGVTLKFYLLIVHKELSHLTLSQLTLFNKRCPKLRFGRCLSDDVYTQHHADREKTQLAITFTHLIGVFFGAVLADFIAPSTCHFHFV